MRAARSIALLLTGAALFAGNANAASTVFGGSVTARVGYGKNPSFLNGVDGSSAVFGGDVTATLARITGTGRTALTGSADVTQTTGGNGRTENYYVRLNQALQVNPKFSLSGDVGYQDSTNPNATFSTESRDLVPIGDVLTIGTHTRQVNGDVNAAYQLNANDLIQGGFNAMHTTYSDSRASPYTQYGGSLGYLRTISAATRVGVNFSILKVDSDLFSTTTSYTGGLVLTQKIGKFWTFQGGLNGVLQKAFGGSYKTIGFNASLCGDYPRLNICVLASRQSAASGIGGLRIDTQAGMRVNYQLTSLSSVDFEATYDVSKARQFTFPTQRYVDTALNYRRTITPRISAGFSGRYQHRTSGAVALGAFGNRQSSYVGTADIVYNFGRTS